MTAPSDTASGGRAEADEIRIVANSGVEFSDQLSNIAKALIRAQGSMDEVFKDSTNPHFRSKYAALPACINATKPALLANGIALIQPPTSSADASVVYVTTMFLHESGEWMRCRLGLQPAKDDPQGAGSAITYGRRYTLLGMCGVAPEDDDDGNAASRRTRTQRPASDPAERAPQSAERAPAASQSDGKRDPNHPGSASEESKAKLARALGLLSDFPGFGTARELSLFSEATNGRVTDGVLNELSENEARRLGKLLRPFVDEAKIRNEALESERAREQDRIEETELPL